MKDPNHRVHPSLIIPNTERDINYKVEGNHPPFKHKLKTQEPLVMLILLETHGNSVKAINLGVAIYQKGTICYQPMQKDYEIEFF